MNNWDVDRFKNAIVNYQRYIVRNRQTHSVNVEDYNLASKMDIYRYLAEVVLGGEVFTTTVIGWTQEKSKGPREVNHISKMESFLHASLINDQKGREIMKTKYSVFTKERVYEAHKAILAYLFEYGEEEAFWEMCNVMERVAVTLPLEVYNAIQGFIDQYLEIELFGEIMGSKERVEFDLSEMEQIDKVCPNPEVGEGHVSWFKMKNMYDNIVEKYIRPVLGAE